MVYENSNDQKSAQAVQRGESTHDGRVAKQVNQQGAHQHSGESYSDGE